MPAAPPKICAGLTSPTRASSWVLSAFTRRLIQISDSRFQRELLQEAQRGGKVGTRYQVPEWCRGNTPERLDHVLSRYRASGLFPSLPFGTDLTHEEIVLKKALERQGSREVAR
jgi:hypothetical protein